LLLGDGVIRVVEEVANIDKAAVGCLELVDDIDVSIDRGTGRGEVELKYSARTIGEGGVLEEECLVLGVAHIQIDSDPPGIPVAAALGAQARLHSSPQGVDIGDGRWARGSHTEC
jgi:hypothetical protein